MLVYFIRHPEEKVENMILHPNFQEYHDEKLLNKARQLRFLHKLVEKNVFGK